MDSGRCRCAQRSSIATGAPASVRKNTIGSPRMVRPAACGRPRHRSRRRTSNCAGTWRFSLLPILPFRATAREGALLFSCPALAGRKDKRFRSRESASACGTTNATKETIATKESPPNKKGGGAPRSAPTGAASTSDAARALSPVFPLREDRGPGLSLGPQKMERARSPFGAPPRHPRFFGLGSAQAALPGTTGCKREDPLRHQCSEHLAVRHAPDGTMPKPPASAVYRYAHENRSRSALRSTLAKGVPLRAGFWVCNRDRNKVKGDVALLGTRRRTDWRSVIRHPIAERRRITPSANQPTLLQVTGGHASLWPPYVRFILSACHRCRP